MRVLVTGSRGFIGQRVMALLVDCGHTAVGADLDHSVLSDGFPSVAEGCDAAIHLAAHKYAGMGEEYPAEVAELNIVGTRNVVRALAGKCAGFGPEGPPCDTCSDNPTCPKKVKVILASTCKAAAPITAYGASKLIAERIVLNAGGTVVRLVNVLGSTGSVLDIWERIPASEPLPVTVTERMFITPDQAATLFVRALDLEPGRYGPNVAAGYTLGQLAEATYPGRPTVTVPLRRGDRPVERLVNDYETTVPLGDVVRIVDLWERPDALEVAA